jgi:hypothetical protein
VQMAGQQLRCWKKSTRQSKVSLFPSSGKAREMLILCVHFDKTFEANEMIEHT